MLIHHLPILEKIANYLTLKSNAVAPVRPKTDDLPKDVVSISRKISKKAIKAPEKTSRTHHLDQPDQTQQSEDDEPPQIDIKV